MVSWAFKLEYQVYIHSVSKYEVSKKKTKKLTFLIAGEMGVCVPEVQFQDPVFQTGCFPSLSVSVSCAFLSLICNKVNF